MRTYGNKSQVKNLSVKNISVKNKIEKNVENRICAARHSISENFNGNKSQAGKIKTIHYPVDEYSEKMQNFSHKLNKSLFLGQSNNFILINPISKSQVVFSVVFFAPVVFCFLTVLTAMQR